MGINIWKNSNITIDNTPVFYRRWYEKHVVFIKDLLNIDGKIMSFEEFQNKYGIQCNVLQFLGIKTAITNYMQQSNIDLSIDPLPLTHCVIPFNTKLILKQRKESQDMYTGQLRSDDNFKFTKCHAVV